MDKVFNRLKWLLLLLPFMFFASCDAFTDRTTKVSGKVIDAGTGIGIAEAIILVEGRDISGLLLPIIPSKTYGSTRTDSFGNYEIVFEAEDKQTSYYVKVFAREYEEFDSALKAGKNNELNVVLKPL